MDHFKQHLKDDGISYFFYATILFSLSFSVWLIFFSGHLQEAIFWVEWFIQDKSYYIYLVAFFVSLAEGSVILFIVPGSTSLVILGFFLGQGYLSIPILLTITSLGAFLGNLLGYGLGRVFSNYIKRKHYDQHKHYILGKRFITENGGKSIFFAKFASGIKEIVPAMAGILRMDLKKFIFYNLSGSIVWATVWMGIGYFAGSYAKATGPVARTVGLIFLFSFCWMVFVYHKKMADKLKQFS